MHLYLGDYHTATRTAGTQSIEVGTLVCIEITRGKTYCHRFPAHKIIE